MKTKQIALLVALVTVCLTGCENPILQDLWTKSGGQPGDTTAPALSGGRAANLSTATGTTAALKFSSNEAGTYYYTVLPRSDAAPDAAAVKAAGAGIHGSGPATAAANTIDISGLATASLNTAYIAVEDAAGNLSAALAIARVNPRIRGADPAKDRADDSEQALIDAGEITASVPKVPGPGNAQVGITVNDDGTVTIVIDGSSRDYPYEITEDTITVIGGGAGGSDADLGYIINPDGTLTLENLDELRDGGLSGGPVVSNPNPGLTPPPTPPMPTPALTVTPPVFGPVAYGYVQPAAKNITIANSGTAAASISAVTLTAGDTSAFTLGGTGNTVSAGGSIATRTVQPESGLAAGTHTATITVTYDGGATATAVVSITVNKAAITPVVSAAPVTLPAQPSPSVSGNPGSGAVTYTYSTTQTGGYSAAVPTTVGTYWVKATVAETGNYLGGESAPVSFDISLAPVPALAVTPLVFGPVAYGYVQPAAENITISNSGTATANISAVALTAGATTAFTLGGTGNTVSAGGSIATRTVQPESGLAAGTYMATITVTYDGGATATADVSITVNKAAITPVVTAAGVTYPTAPSPSVSGGNPGGGTVTYTYSTSQTGGYSATIPTTAGTYWVKAAVAETANYLGGVSEPVSFVINKAAITPVVSVASVTIPGTPSPSVSSGNPGGGVVSFTYATSSGGVYSAGAPTTAGTYWVKAAVAETANYLGGESAPVSFVISPAPVPALTVTPPVFDAVTYGYAQPAAKNITITNSGTAAANINNVALTAGDTTAFTLGGTGGTVTAGSSITTRTVQPESGLAAGTYTATVTVTYDGGATATADVSITVNKAAITPVVSAASVTYPTALSPSVSSGNPGGGTVTYTYSTTQTGGYSTTVPTTAGTYWVKATVAETGNYLGGDSAPVSFVINKAAITPVVSAASVTYPTAPSPSVSSGNPGGGVVSFTYATSSGGVYSPGPLATAGTYWVKATVGATDNYLGGVSAPVAFDIHKAAITPVVSAASVTYPATPSPSVSSGNLGGGVVTYTYSTTETGGYSATVPTTAGTYWVKATVGATDNYLGGDSAPVSFVINKAAITPVMTVADVTVPTAPIPSMSSGNPGGGVVTYTYSTTETGGYSATVPTTAGTYWVKATVGATDNYLGGDSAPVSFVIYPAGKVTVTAWVADYAITTDKGLTHTLDRSDGDTLAINVTGGGPYTDYQWTLGSTVVASGAGASSYSFTAVGKDTGKYSLTLRVVKDSVPYSTVFTITVQD
ncbi:hypothetical protein AGMMS49928_12220 [Spirochaetia bacterium]|nr:hypothetical protein AGMMS49928_12220 [Spirochaetia bacterium]